MNITTVLQTQPYTIIDVRTYHEFIGGNVAGSINIPLNEIPHRMDEIAALQQPIITCCASGMRSEQATQFFNQQQIVCYNGGSWLDVNYLIAKNN